MISDPSDLILAPWVTGVVVTAVRLGVFTAAADRALSLEEIASACQARPERLGPLLGACVGLGLLSRQDGRFRNSDFSRAHLTAGRPQYIGDILQLLNDEAASWAGLAWLIRGRGAAEPAPEAANPYRTFIRGMDNLGRLGEAEALAGAVDLSGCREMVDAGGGSGLYSLTLCRKNPGLRSTIIDVAAALAVTREMIAGQPGADRLTLRQGDFLTDPLGENLDAVLLSDAIYEASAAARALENARQSLAPGGRLIVRGYYADPDNAAPLFGALFAVKELVDRPEERTMTWPMILDSARECGFEVMKSGPLTARSLMLVAVR